jgi:hypothetical protein
MLDRIQLLRNVGQFDSVNAGAQLPLSKLALVYAENGRGKTTLAAILRSLSTGDPTTILERHRLSATNAPHVVLRSNGTSFVFENDAWSATHPNLAVFDDVFVAQNVCSGIDIQTEHRQNLHELILGSQGVSLNAVLQTHVARVEEHNRELRFRADAIPAASRGTFSVDAFCALEQNPNIGPAIEDAAALPQQSLRRPGNSRNSEFSKPGRFLNVVCVRPMSAVRSMLVSSPLCWTRRPRRAELAGQHARRYGWQYQPSCHQCLRPRSLPP